MTMPPPPDPNQQFGGIQPPPAVPAKKSKKKLIIGIVVAVVVVLGAIGAVVVSKTATASAPVGACIKITSPTTAPPTTSQEPCSSQAAIWVVVETGGSDVSCGTGENSYTEGSSTKVCLRDNLTVGECQDLGAGATDVPKKVDCAAPGSASTIKLVALLTDSADPSKCPSGTTVPIALPKRNMLYCYTPAA